MAVKEPQRMLKGVCPFCKTVIEYPESDRVDVILFDNWRKYHYCDEAKKYDEEKRSRPS